MTGPSIVVDEDEVLKAIGESKRPLSETAILLNVLSSRGLRVKEEPGENASDAIREEFNLSSFRRVLNRLKQQGYVEVLTGAQWRNRGRDFYDQRPNGKYWYVRESQMEPVHPKVSVPKVMRSPRELIHRGFCGTHGRCRYGALRMEPISRACKELDALLDFNDEQILHAKAREIEGLPQTNVVSRCPGIANVNRRQVLDVVDPYVRVEAFVNDEIRPDCPSCVTDREHYHRKSDGSPVRMPGGAEGSV